MPAEQVSNPDGVKRINVAVSPGSVDAIRLIMDNEQCNLTEAVRRLLSYGDFIYRAVKVDGDELVLRRGDVEREVVLIR